ncbi:hypothetical protein [Paraherbaspirillum soli]|uniref:XRE family transcriptional regulator n=1 Tax=Paraherbaspirillum soli TaxID=631222 RepID=A0ABW0MFZ8_9BURK
MTNLSERKEEEPQTLADFLKAVRLQQKSENGKRLSLTAIHHRCGLSVPMLSKLEAGKIVDPCGSTIKGLLSGYNLKFEDFEQFLPTPGRNAK